MDAKQQNTMVQPTKNSDHHPACLCALCALCAASLSSRHSVTAPGSRPYMRQLASTAAQLLAPVRRGFIPQHVQDKLLENEQLIQKLEARLSEGLYANSEKDKTIQELVATMSDLEQLSAHSQDVEAITNNNQVRQVSCLHGNNSPCTDLPPTSAGSQQARHTPEEQAVHHKEKADMYEALILEKDQLYHQLEAKLSNSLHALMEKDKTLERLEATVSVLEQQTTQQLQQKDKMLALLQVQDCHIAALHTEKVAQQKRIASLVHEDNVAHLQTRVCLQNQMFASPAIQTQAETILEVAISQDNYNSSFNRPKRNSSEQEGSLHSWVTTAAATWGSSSSTPSQVSSHSLETDLNSNIVLCLPTSPGTEKDEPPDNFGAEPGLSLASGETTTGTSQLSPGTGVSDMAGLMPHDMDTKLNHCYPTHLKF